MYKGMLKLRVYPSHLGTFSFSLACSWFDVSCAWDVYLSSAHVLGFISVSSVALILASLVLFLFFNDMVLAMGVHTSWLLYMALVYH